MGQPVTHFEVIGKDGEKLRGYYSELFGWEIDANNPMNYGLVGREGNLSPEGIGIGGGIGQGPEGYDGHVTFYVGVDDVEATLAKAESLGGKRLMGPDELDTPTGKIVLGHITDPEGHLIGLVQPVM
jgi:predicted enzyme related to lactoylglutathione lyase